MCYSAEVVADFAAFQRLFPSSKLLIKEFFNLYWRRKTKPKPLLQLPKAMDAMLLRSGAAEAVQIRELIDEFRADQVTSTEQELFVQRTRLAAAERTLREKETKKALEDQRISTSKIAKALAKLEGLRRTELRPSDSRFFPLWWAPVLLIEDGQPMIRPMRYQCRPAGKPANYDVRFAGSYNARRDNLKSSFWGGVFGHTHCVIPLTAFFENVARHAAEHRELQPGEKTENMVLQFRPEPMQTLWVAGLYSHWVPPAGSDEPDLWSFAAVTDEPLPEVAAAGHDRTIVVLQEKNIRAWLTPEGRSPEELDALLEDKQRPYYEHRLAA